MNSSISEKIRSHKILSLFLSIIIIIMIFMPLFYWSSTRKSEDPRVEKVKIYSKEYDKSMKRNDLANAFSYLDSIQFIYNSNIDYQKSNEMGQVLNMKAVNWIRLALVETNENIKKTYLDSARYFAQSSIKIFEEWMEDFNHLSRNEVIIKIKGNYLRNDSTFIGRNLVKIINNRTDEIMIDQKETARHISIAYTNLGTVYQYDGDFKMAIKSNRKALDIWNNNETAKKNIKSLIDRSYH